MSVCKPLLLSLLLVRAGHRPAELGVKRVSVPLGIQRFFSASHRRARAAWHASCAGGCFARPLGSGGVAGCPWEPQ